MTRKDRDTTATAARLTRDWKKSCGDKPNNPNSFLDELDKLHAEASKYSPPTRPAESFTLTMYAERYKIPKTVASRHIEKLRRAGKVKLCGNGAAAYYIFTLKS